MMTLGRSAARCAVFIATLLGLAACIAQAPTGSAKAKIEVALKTATISKQAGKRNYAWVWDHNAYIQCWVLPDRAMRCESAGALMQPSLRHILVADRLARQGWRLDPSFGNYARTFPAGTPLDQVADEILAALASGYGATIFELEIENSWVASEPCPPRNGPGQNLAGLIDDAPAMAPTAVHGCAYVPLPDTSIAPQPKTPTGSAEDLIHLYGDAVMREIDRLRASRGDRRFVVLLIDAGYVQCETQIDPHKIYCEAESADLWPALAAILTPDRVAHLHEAGFADPGLTQNYSRIYRLDAVDDRAIARALLTILHDVYGYDGTPPLKRGNEHAAPQ